MVRTTSLLALLLFSSLLKTFTATAPLQCENTYPPGYILTPNFDDMLIIVSRRLVKLCYDSDDRPATQKSFEQLAIDLDLYTLNTDAAEYMFSQAMVNSINKINTPFGINCEVKPTFEQYYAGNFNNQLLPEVEFGFLGDHRIDVASGVAGNVAAYSFCERIIAGGTLAPGALEICANEANTAINRQRGRLFSFSNRYRYETNLLLCQALPRDDTECPVEGGTFFYAFKFPALKNLLDVFLLSNAKSKRNVNVCEVGFNMGHSSLLWLMQDDRVTVRAFDIGEHDYSRAASAHITRRFGGDRFSITFGDSTKTLPEFAQRIKAGVEPKCDVVFVDGGHTVEVATSDIMNFGHAVVAGGDHLLIVDDINQGGVAVAWKNAKDGGLVGEAGVVYEDVFYANVEASRSAIGYGFYLK